MYSKVCFNCKNVQYVTTLFVKNKCFVKKISICDRKSMIDLTEVPCELTSNALIIFYDLITKCSMKSFQCSDTKNNFKVYTEISLFIKYINDVLINNRAL